MAETQICRCFIDDSNLWIEAKVRKFAVKENDHMPALQGTGGKNEGPQLRIDIFEINFLSFLFSLLRSFLIKVNIIR
jgi:hypothetical protein